MKPLDDKQKDELIALLIDFGVIVLCVGFVLGYVAKTLVE